jgi:diketogulonate reductase-like aldo/keto reductase
VVKQLNSPLQHWPVAFARGNSPFPKGSNGKAKIAEGIDYIETWKAMEKLHKSGKAKAIGISNFSRAETEHLLENASVVRKHSMHLLVASNSPR